MEKKDSLSQSARSTPDARIKEKAIESERERERILLFGNDKEETKLFFPFKKKGISSNQMSSNGEQMDPHMQRFLEEEKRKAVFNEVVAQLANACFEKCVTSPSAKLTSYEATCLSNCALRYMESGQVILQKMQQG